MISSISGVLRMTYQSRLAFISKSVYPNPKESLIFVSYDINVGIHSVEYYIIVALSSWKILFLFLETYYVSEMCLTSVFNEN